MSVCVIGFGDDLMELLTKELRERIPKLYSQEDVTDPIVVAKFFTPDANWSWYVLEFDGRDIFFGYVDGLQPELGYFTLSELTDIRGPMGMKIERDIYWDEKPLSEVEKDVEG
jgi:hypothetical protein